MFSLFSSSHPIFRIFPVPNILSPQSTGVAIRERSICYLNFERREGLLRVGRFGTIPLPEGVIFRGRVNKPQALKEALINLRGFLRTPFIRLALPESESYLFSMKVPVLGPEDTRESIAFSMEEHVPIPTSEVVFDYTPASSSKEVATREVVVSVVPRSAINSYYDLAIASGLVPFSMEVECSASARAVIPKSDPGTSMTVDIGSSRTVISIVSGGLVRFTTTIDLGGDALTAAINKRFGDSGKDIRALKCEDGITQTKTGKELFSALVGTLSALKDELEKRITYWNGYRGEDAMPTVSRVIIFGEEAELKGLPEYLSSALLLPVSLANIWSNSVSFDQYIPPIELCASLPYASAVGAASRD
ncbi:MAG: pilus assembly protein PilM [Patescibacteria group bacterium]